MKQPIDLATAYIVTSAKAAGPEAKAVDVLSEEFAKRTGIVLPRSHTVAEAGGPAIVVGTAAALEDILRRFADKLSELAQLKPEGYALKTVRTADSTILFVIGADARGVLYGVGKFLRKARLLERSAEWDADAKLVSSPRYPIRGHQLGYRPKTNAYDAWTPEQFEQYIRELALFGANAIEILPPRTDDAPTGPLMKVEPMEMMIRLSGIIASYGLDVWIWYPNMADDYTDPQVKTAELAEREDIFHRLPAIHAVLIPGSDPGGMHPDLLFDWSEEVSRLLQRYHPSARVWLSPQVMKYEPKPWLAAFYRQLEREPEWLGGVAYGPHVDELLPEFRVKIPARYPIRRYEDITHNYQCQYPVADWDLAFALTLGRECYNPRPLAYKAIHNLFAPYAQGNISYSEGINDDVNKFIWSDQDWNPDTPAIETLREYARLFVGCDYAEAVACGLMALEDNWRGPLAVNERVEVTLAQWMQLEEEAPPLVLRSYRFQMGLLRAYYDAYVKRRLIYETELACRAKDALRAASATGSLAALDRAEQALRLAREEPVAQDYKRRCEELADELFAAIGSQLTVARHHAIATERGAFLDTIDAPLNDADWLLTVCRTIRAENDERARLAAIRRALGRTNPGPGGYYDNLGSYTSAPRIDPGMGWECDPSYLFSPRTAPSAHLLAMKEERRNALGGVPLAWISHINTMTDTPITVTYDNLDPDSRYTVQVAYVGDTVDEDHPRDARVSLTANDRFVLQDNVLVHEGDCTLCESPVPPEALADGVLKLTFRRVGGFKRLNVAEIWIVRR